jgi:aspartyl-tRNA(Asn)/glutamyl-tRNA(Gln) amidotransferase subunit B
MRYKESYQLSEYDATVLTEDRAFSDYFEEMTQSTTSYKAAANWLLGPVRSWMNEHDKEIEDFPLPAKQLACLQQLVEEGKVSFSVASSRIFPLLLDDPGKSPGQIAKENNLLQQSAQSSIEPIIDKVLEKYAEKVKEYKKGKKGLLALFVGEVMKQSKGTADPKVTNELLIEKLKS